MDAAKAMTTSRMMTVTTDTMSPDLTQAEIDRICHPLKQCAAQVRYLTEVLGLTVERRPGGQPLVWRAHVEAIKGPAMAGRTPTPSSRPGEPDMGALQAHLAAKVAARKQSHGPKTQGR
jgi:hypothetical protein